MENLNTYFHKLSTDEVFCYFNKKVEKLNLITKKKKEVNYFMCGNLIKCGSGISNKVIKISLLTQQTQYWYFWLLYIITAFFTIKSLKIKS
jgi:hypothetical protein